MAEKLGPGVWHEGGPAPAEAPPSDRDRAEEERLKGKRDNARWSAVMGFAMLFAASFSAAFAVGGLLMILYGAAASIYWSWRLRRVKGDPWAYDPELDGPHGMDWKRP